MPRCDALSFFIISNGVSMTSKHQMEHIINRSLGGGNGVYYPNQRASSTVTFSNGTRGNERNYRIF